MKFIDTFFTQIDRATIGSPDSGSSTDIFGSIHIDKTFESECPKKPENFKRYRDDTINVCRNSSEKEQEEVTKWMNKNIYKDKIAFKTESIGEETKFLDTNVNIIKDHKADDEDRFLLIPSMYSKRTDTHQYLSPKSCHLNLATQST